MLELTVFFVINHSVKSFWGKKMKKIFTLVLILLVVLSCNREKQNVKAVETPAKAETKEATEQVKEEKEMSIYDFTVKDRKGNDVPMSNFKGKVLLIVNTATGCGFTPQYEGLEKLWKEYHHKGLEILDFPCDQFGHQAPGTDDEIHQFCQLKFATSFDNFKKIEVNGENELPLYTFLKSKKSFAGFTGEKAEFMDGFITKMDPDYKNNSKIKWNFTKFLVNRDGEVIERFESTVEPAEIADKILSLL